MFMGMCKCVHMCIEARGQPSGAVHIVVPVSHWDLHLLFLRSWWGSWRAWLHLAKARSTSVRSDFYTGAGCRIQVLMFTQQTLYPVSHTQALQCLQCSVVEFVFNMPGALGLFLAPQRETLLCIL